MNSKYKGMFLNDLCPNIWWTSAQASWFDENNAHSENNVSEWNVL